MNWPDPADVLRQAELEPVRLRGLEPYVTVVRTLRDKGWTYRRIAEWLNAKGVPCNGSKVYRVFIKEKDV